MYLLCCLHSAQADPASHFPCWTVLNNQFCASNSKIAQNLDRFDLVWKIGFAIWHHWIIAGILGEDKFVKHNAYGAFEHASSGSLVMFSYLKFQSLSLSSYFLFVAVSKMMAKCRVKVSKHTCKQTLGIAGRAIHFSGWFNVVLQ